MSKDFEVKFLGSHIHVELGPNYVIEPENKDDFWEMLKEACDKYGSRRVLIEGSIPSGGRDAAAVVAAGERAAAVPNVWLALHLDDFVPNERSELFQVIAAARGVRAKFFSDNRSAMQWLESNAEK